MARILSGIAALVKALALAGLVVLVWVKWPDVMRWAAPVTHLELPWIKFDRTAATEKIREISATHKDINVAFAEGALVRAELVHPALSGAQILWVDGHPENNRLEEGILRDIGIDVRRA